MALISCPECGKDVSDKVKSCPHCGYPLINELENTGDNPQPVEITSINLGSKDPKKKKNTLIFIVAVMLVVIAVIITCFFVKQQKEAAVRAEYIENLTLIRTTMLSGGAQAETLCNLTKSVWYNTIYEEFDIETNKYTMTNGRFHEDFNTSLSALYEDSNTISVIAEIKENQDKVADIMRELQNPTADFATCYNTVEAMYDTYRSFTALAISPSGSLKTYADNFETYETDFMKYYERLDTQIPTE